MQVKVCIHELGLNQILRMQKNQFKDKFREFSETRSRARFLDEIREISFSFLENFYFQRKTRKRDSILSDFTKIISLFEGLRNFLRNLFFLITITYSMSPCSRRIPTLPAGNWFILCHTRTASERVKSLWALVLISNSKENTSIESNC